MNQQAGCHYRLGDSPRAVDAILREGLKPLSDRPDSARWQALERENPGFYPALYKMLAEPVLQRPYINSGVFLTPIDFRKMPDQPLALRPRLAIPLAAVNGAHAIVTYTWDDERSVLPLTAETLRETAERWPAERVRAWFGRDNTRLFFHVSQVATYQPGGIRIQPTWFEAER